MPLPLVFIGAAALTGAFGVGNVIKAGIDQYDADETNRLAKRTYRKSTEVYETSRSACIQELENLGRFKMTILENRIKPFVEEFGKLNNIVLTETRGTDELQRVCMDNSDFLEIKELESIADKMAEGFASGTMTGALTVFGAYGAASTFATASTGTAIASLSGAAATNATLAFFGGGSLAAGGLGIAGGTLVLGGLAAGPALAILGSVVGAQASENKDMAYSHLEEAEAAASELDAMTAVFNGAKNRAYWFIYFLKMLDFFFEDLIDDLHSIITNSGTDYRSYTKNEKITVAEAVSLAKTVKVIIDTPILGLDGDLNPEVDNIIESTNALVERLANC